MYHKGEKADLGEFPRFSKIVRDFLRFFGDFQLFSDISLERQMIFQTCFQRFCIYSRGKSSILDTRSLPNSKIFGNLGESIVISENMWRSLYHPSWLETYNEDFIKCGRVNCRFFIGNFRQLNQTREFYFDVKRYGAFSRFY